jgi:hypothetical protein
MVTILPLVFREKIGRFLDDMVYTQYENDACTYIAADDRILKIILTSLLLFFVIYMISFAFLKMANRQKPRLLNIVLMIALALINIFSSMNVPHHYYRINPYGYKICE